MRWRSPRSKNPKIKASPTSSSTSWDTVDMYPLSELFDVDLDQYSWSQSRRDCHYHCKPCYCCQEVTLQYNVQLAEDDRGWSRISKFYSEFFSCNSVISCSINHIFLWINMSICFQGREFAIYSTFQCPYQSSKMTKGNNCNILIFDVLDTPLVILWIPPKNILSSG